MISVIKRFYCSIVFALPSTLPPYLLLRPLNYHGDNLLDDNEVFGEIRERTKRIG